jgi:RND superfamily putative drug exporter
MELLGDRNWWIPAWLDRIIPRLNVEGPSHGAAPAGGAVAPAPAAPEPVLIDA